MNNKELGTLGEKLARNYLEKLNYKIICCNYRTQKGEIDLIANKNNVYIFIEVKTRQNIQFGLGRDSVNKIKQKHIKEVSKYYMHKNNLENESIRFDIIEIYYIEDKFYLRHLKNVLW